MENKTRTGHKIVNTRRNAQGTEKNRTLVFLDGSSFICFSLAHNFVRRNTYDKMLMSNTHGNQNPINMATREFNRGRRAQSGVDDEV